MTERDAVIPSFPNSLSLQYFLYFGSRRSSTCRACSAAALCTCSITRPPHLLVLCRRILRQITRAIYTMSPHFSRLCLCKEGCSCTTSYLIKTFSNLTVSCASDLCFFCEQKSGSQISTSFPDFLSALSGFVMTKSS